MTANDPVLEVLRDIKSELAATRMDIGQLVRHAQHTNMRLDEHGAILRRQEARLESIDSHVAVLDRHAVATVATLELLHGGMQAMARRFDLGQLGEQRLETRVEDCERRIDALDYDVDR